MGPLEEMIWVAVVVVLQTTAEIHFGGPPEKDRPIYIAGKGHRMLHDAIYYELACLRACCLSSQLA